MFMKNEFVLLVFFFITSISLIGQELELVDFKSDVTDILAFVDIIEAIDNTEEETQYNSFRPGELWHDNDGEILNAHGGGILEHDGKYYWFGTHLETGHQSYVGVRCYSSSDLYNWENEGVALPVVTNDADHDITAGCVIERPKVIYNELTGKFVMWFHLELRGQGYKAALAAVAVADNVTGPYTFIESLRPNAGHWPLNFTEAQKNTKYDYDIGRYTAEGRQNVVDGRYVVRDFKDGQMSRDMTLFVDDDQKAYLVTSSEENQTLHIHELTDDYLGFTGRYTRVLPGERNEAAAVFKHQGKYFMIASGLTGWDPNPARSAVAEDVLGPWISLGNPAIGTEEQIKTTFNSQSTYVLPVKVADDVYIYMGDRWNPANQLDSRYVWLPLYMEYGKPVIRWRDEWSLEDYR